MRHIITAVLFIFSLNALFASDEAYKTAMKENIAAMDQTQNPEELQAIANSFERISKMAPKEWLPVYYTALSYLRIGIFEQNNAKKEVAFDKAKPFLDKAIELAPTESEVLILEGYWNMMKLAIDPVSRSQVMAPKVTELLNQAQAKDPENPRVYLLKGHMDFGTAQFFGSSTDNACALFKKSVSLFEKAPSDVLAPNWGKGEAEYMLSNCK